MPNPSENSPTPPKGDRQKPDPELQHLLTPEELEKLKREATETTRAFLDILRDKKAAGPTPDNKPKPDSALQQSLTPEELEALKREANLTRKAFQEILEEQDRLKEQLDANPTTDE